MSCDVVYTWCKEKEKEERRIDFEQAEPPTSNFCGNPSAEVKG